MYNNDGNTITGISQMTTHYISQFWAVARRMMEQIADRRARKKSGVVAGGPYDRVYVDDSGHVYAASGNGLTLLALYSGTTGAASVSLPVSDTEYRVQWNTMIYDPQGLVTTGASWVFTAPRDGYYLVAACSGTSTIEWFDGDTIYLAPNSGAFVDQWKAPLPSGDAGSHVGLFTLNTSGVIYRTAGQTIYFSHGITNSGAGTLPHGGHQIAIYG